jgi:hypothetical protein
LLGWGVGKKTQKAERSLVFLDGGVCSTLRDFKQALLCFVHAIVPNHLETHLCWPHFVCTPTSSRVDDTKTARAFPPSTSPAFSNKPQHHTHPPSKSFLLLMVTSCQYYTERVCVVAQVARTRPRCERTHASAKSLRKNAQGSKHCLHALTHMHRRKTAKALVK